MIELEKLQFTRAHGYGANPKLSEHRMFNRPVKVGWYPVGIQMKGKLFEYRLTDENELHWHMTPWLVVFLNTLSRRGSTVWSEA
jgi:hypothetical protein